MQHTLALVHEAQSAVTTQAATYCDAHNILHRVIEESKHHAQALESLAHDMLATTSKPKKRLFDLYTEPDRPKPDKSQLTPIGQSLRSILNDDLDED